MQQELILVKIKSDYCDYLRQFDSRVPFNHSKKETRPFVGVLFMIGSLKYFAPLSSPKPKHLKLVNKIDFMKIKNRELGAINFNNMLPVNDNNIEIINMKENLKDKKYYMLLNEQIIWLNRHNEMIYNKSYTLYTKYVNNLLAMNVKIRCCNFKLLEVKC